MRLAIEETITTKMADSEELAIKTHYETIKMFPMAQGVEIMATAHNHPRKL